MKPIKPGDQLSWDELVELTPKDADQPRLPLEAEKRRAEKPVKALQAFGGPAMSRDLPPSEVGR